MSRVGAVLTADRPGAAGGSARSGRVVGMARGGGVNLLAAVVNQVSLLLITLVLARWLGRDDVGRYAQGFALFTLLGLLALSGLRAGMTRFVAVHLADDDAPTIRGTVRLGLLLSTLSALLIGVVLVLAARPIASALGDGPGAGHLSTAVRLVGLALPAMAYAQAALAATQGWRTQVPYAVISNIVQPLTQLALTIALVALGAGVVGAFTGLLASAWLSALLSWWALHRRMARLPGSNLVYRPRQLFGFSSVSWAATLASSGLIWADTLLLGALAGNADVGLYNVSTRLVTLAVFVMAPLNSTLQPFAAHLFHVGDRAGLQHAYALGTGWILRLSLPAFVLLLVFPRDLLNVFGRDFRSGATITIILALGKLVDAGTGPCGLMLAMSGRPAVNMADNIAALVLNVGLNVALIPAYGVIGAAIAWTVSLTALNLTRLWQVHHLLAMLPTGSGAAKGVAAAVLAAAAGVVVRVLVPGTFRTLLVGIVVVAVVYAGGVLALGIGRDDRLLLRRLVSRTRPT